MVVGLLKVEFKLKLNAIMKPIIYLLMIIVWFYVYTDIAHIIPARGVMPTIQQNTSEVKTIFPRENR